MKNISNLMAVVAALLALAAAGCRNTGSPYQPGPVVGQTVGAGAGVVAGNAVGFGKGAVGGTIAGWTDDSSAVRFARGPIRSPVENAAADLQLQTDSRSFDESTGEMIFRRQSNLFRETT